MGEQYHFLALDFGASSGRGELVTLEDGVLHLQEIHRFENRPVKMGGTMYWDFPYLFGEVIETLKVVAKRGIKLAGIGVDTWGVDFGLLAADGKLLSNPVHYRDTRTENIHAYSDPIMSRDEVFAATAMEPWTIGSLFQLLAMQRDNSPLLKAADTMLWMADLFRYFLCGKKVAELSLAQTSCLIGTNRKLSSEVVKRFKLKRKMFPQLVRPPLVLGDLLPEIVQAAGLSGPVPVIATAGHDTAAAVAAVPARGSDWAFLSCGTWSITGTLVKHPVATPEALKMGYSCECTIGDWFTCKNIPGLWVVQELRRKWHSSEDPWDFNRMVAEAAAVSEVPLFDVNHPTLMAPADMEDALRKLLPGGAALDRGHLVRSALESLAAEYARSIDAIATLTGKRPSALYMVGGGIKNKLLCQLTADACNMTVYAGVDECTAVGNGLGQALALGIIKTKGDIRKIARASFEMSTFMPENRQHWQAKLAQYAQLQAGK
ncbi:MAG: hypothetical protein LLG01_05655 [Planctomycetaceae bacterium]|nr:hypothetical protein [Planctomycetaceae bacterium]